ncbi:MAG: helix-turn-helix domain-containing protein [Pseudomonadota bacterium]
MLATSGSLRVVQELYHSRTLQECQSRLAEALMHVGVREAQDCAVQWSSPEEQSYSVELGPGWCQEIRDFGVTEEEFDEHVISIYDEYPLARNLSFHIDRRVGLISLSHRSSVKHRGIETVKELPQDYGLKPYGDLLLFNIGIDQGKYYRVSLATDADLSDHDGLFVNNLLSAYALLRPSLSQPERESDERSIRPDLNKIQHEILVWLTVGKTVSEVSSIIGIKERTIRYHIDQVKRAYGVRTTIQAIVQAAKDFDLDPMVAKSIKL